MTIFGYTLAEVQKFLIALAGLIIAGVAMFITLDPSFQAAVETLLIALIGVVSVFAVPNPTQDDVYKALSAFVSAAIAVIQFYHTVPSSTTTKVIALVYAFAVVYVIWRKSNTRSVQPAAAARVRQL